MTTKAPNTASKTGAPVLADGTSDAYGWTNALGGDWSTIGNWTDLTTGNAANVAPGAANAVTIAGGSAGFTNITGSGTAASLTLSGDVLLWGTVAVGGGIVLTQPQYGMAADVELDGGAKLTAATIYNGNAATLEVGGASSLGVTGMGSLSGWLTVVASSTAQFGAFSMGAGTGSYSYGTINIDDAAALNVGTSAAPGKVVLFNTRLAVGDASRFTAFGPMSLDGGSMGIDSGSTATVASLLTGGNTYVELQGASSAQFGVLIANPATYITVDPFSTIEVGTLGGAAAGALTIDKGATAPIAGSINGNVVVNGTLTVQAGASLQIDPSYYQAGTVFTIGGTGALVLNENSTLQLGAADSVPIQFAGPLGTLVLSTLPSASISGFVAGDVIEMTAGQATGVSYKQTSSTLATLTLTKAGATIGTLSLAGNYTGGLFHMSFDGQLNSFITLQTIGVAPVQPLKIKGTAGIDQLRATANNQFLIGLGGGDSLNANGFTGTIFKDLSANLDGSTISGFDPSATIDLSDMVLAKTTVTYYSAPYTAPSLMATDGTHTARIAFPYGMSLPLGYFKTVSDGATGTNLTYVAVNTDAYQWNNNLGGSFAVAANWQDVTTNSVASVPPSFGNAVTIYGGASFTNVTGNGVAASLALGGDVLQWGSLNIGSTVIGVSGSLSQYGALALDGGAQLILAGTASLNGNVQIGGASTLTAAGGLVLALGNSASASLLAIGGSTAQFASQSNSSSYSTGNPYTIGVDATSIIEIGTAGGAAKGALTVDSGVTASLDGTVDGNVVVNGLLIAGQNGGSNAALTIGTFGGIAPVIGGSGTIEVAPGATLTLAGKDTAAIQMMNSSSYYAVYDILVLNGALPTGAISGFVTGNSISVAQTLTSLSYSQTSAAGGTLTLKNGATTVGALNLAGSFAASQFQLEPGAPGQASTIVYAPTPSTAGGTAVSVNSDSFNWNNSSGGNWSNPANWRDNYVPALQAPGAGNSVSIYQGSKVTPLIISGNGSAASVYVSGGAVFTGSISVGGGFTEHGWASIASGASLTTAGMLSVGGVLQVAGAVTAAALSLGNPSNSLLVTAGGSIKVLNNGISSTLYGTLAVDTLSSIEFGSAGGAAAGGLTVDSGQTLTMDGGAIYSNIVLNGVLQAGAPYGYSGNVVIGGWGSALGAITGSGTLVIPYGTHLTLNASDTAAIAFVRSYYGSAAGTLELQGPKPTGVISGFLPGDVIQLDKPVTGISFAQTTTTQGTLTLTNGGAAIGSLTLAGNFASNIFHADVAPASGVATVTLQTAPSAAGTGTVSTTKDAYYWSGTSGGNWATSANWTDQTNSSVTGAIPGSLNAVSVSANSNPLSYTVIGGNGAAASLSINGNVLQTGTVAVTTQLKLFAVSVGQSELALDGAAKLTAGSASVINAIVQASGSVVRVAGNATVSGGSLRSFNGSTLQFGGLLGTNNYGNTNNIAIDANSTVLIGNPAVITKGALTQQNGATAAFAGSIFGNVIANGVLAVPGGAALFIDMAGGAKADPYAANPSIGGTGTLSLTEGSTLGLGAAASTAIQFAGPNATLEFAALPTGTISGFAPGDLFQVDTPVTALAFKQTTSTAATLTLRNGAATVGTLNLAGNFAASSLAFHLDAALDGSSAKISLQSIGVAATQPTLIQGTAASDILSPTANGQTLTGLGGGDALAGGAAFTAIDFKDLTANFNGANVLGFDQTDFFDFTDMTLAKATASYSGRVLTVSDGTHTAAFTVGFDTTPSTGSFVVASDGAAGTKVLWQ